MVDHYTEHMKTTRELVDCLNEFEMEGVREYGLRQFPLTYRLKEKNSDDPILVLDTMRGMPVTNQEYVAKVYESLKDMEEFGMLDPVHMYKEC